MGGNKSGGLGLTTVLQRLQGLTAQRRSLCDCPGLTLMVEVFLPHQWPCRRWYRTEMAGVGMVGGRTMTMALGKRKKDRIMIPHSKNGRCVSLGCVGVLSHAGQPNVGQGQGGRQWQSWGWDS